MPVFPRREGGHSELLQLLQELVEGDEDKQGSSVL